MESYLSMESLLCATLYVRHNLRNHLQIRHAYGLTLGVLGVLVGVLELLDDEAFGGFLQGLHCLFLVQNFHSHIGGDLLDELAEGTLLHKEVRRGLQLLDHAQRDGAALETVFSLLDLGFGYGGSG